MNKLLLIVAVATGCLLSTETPATTWSQTEVPDPIAADAVCAVSEPASSGSYIYQWPSKYDQVFWPLTESTGIWYCKTSGFVAFLGDFDKLSDSEKSRIGAYLKQHYVEPSTEPDFKQQLQLLEAIYALRDKSDEFRITLLRALAYLHESELRDAAAARSYREQALQAIKFELDKTLTEENRLEYLFVAAAYEREFGNSESSDRYRDALAVALRTSENDELKNYVEYLQELSADLIRIEPGGVLAPAYIPETGADK